MVCLRGGRGPRQRPGVLAAALLKLAILPACRAVAAAQPARSRRGRWKLGSPGSEGAARDRAWPRSALATACCLTLLAAAATCHAALAQLVPGATR